MRILLLILVFCLFPLLASAADVPKGQVHIEAGKVLRGNFVQQHLVDPTKEPMQTSGHFAVVPGRGLIWSIEEPLATTTIVTHDTAAQDLGGLAIKLPAKNLHHLYDMVSGALAGDWNALETDFTVTPSEGPNHWQVTLTPKQTGDKHALSYALITVSGSRFVENIVMTKADGTYDAFTFSNELVTGPVLSSQEVAQFKEVGQ